MEKGVFATLDPSWSRPRAYPTWGGDVTMEIVGTCGVLSVDVFAQYLVEASNSQGGPSFTEDGATMLTLRSWLISYPQCARDVGRRQMESTA